MQKQLFLKLVYFTGDITMIHSESEIAAERLWAQIDTTTNDVQEASLVTISTDKEYKLLRKLT